MALWFGLIDWQGRKVGEGLELISVSIVIPTWRRPGALRRCLAGIALLKGKEAIREVVVVRRRGDHLAAAVIASCGFPVTEEIVDTPGQVAALIAGARKATGDVVAFLDDDAIPRPAWLETVLFSYSSELVGAVGGRDELHDGLSNRNWTKARVGVVTKWGKLIGNHHLATGQARRVQHLKGANMSVRRDLLTFPCGLKGEGAEVHNDLAVSFAVHQRGMAVIYNPQALVDHFLARRYDEDGRIKKSRRAVRNSAFNLTYTLASLSPALRWRLLLYGLMVGHRAVPGLVRAAVGLATGDLKTFRRLTPSLAGQVEGWVRALRAPLVMRPADDPLFDP